MQRQGRPEQVAAVVQGIQDVLPARNFFRLAAFRIAAISLARALQIEVVQDQELSPQSSRSSGIRDR